MALEAPKATVLDVPATPAVAADELVTRNPWWIPPHLLGRVPAGLPKPALKLLGLVALALFFEEYDMAMLISALRHIASELGMQESELGLYLALIRLGAVPAFFLVPLTDRIGRRPVFIGSTVLLGLLTFATAFVQSPLQFVLLQALSRTFFVTGAAVAFVIVTEELPATHRGWGMGILAALGAVGHGLGAALFSQIDRLPYGWRALYVIGVLPLCCVPAFLRHVRETRRFSNQAASGKHPELQGFFSPLVRLFRAQPLRALGLSTCGLLVAGATLPSFQFSGYYTQEQLGWSPGQYSAMVLAAGALGIVGNVAAGRLGDVFGRKKVGFVLLACFPFASFLFYHSAGALVVAAWVPLVFCSMGGRVILRALSTELFATSYRGAASGVFTVMEALGAVSGFLLVHAYGARDVSDIASVVALVSLAVLGTACLLLLFPETRQRELEELSHGH